MSGVQIVKLVDAATITGPAGPGVPEGGAPGQVLRKASGSNFDTEWTDPPSDATVYTPNDLGIWVGTSPPESAVTYADWLLTRTGYWAYIPTSQSANIAITMYLPPAEMTMAGIVPAITQAHAVGGRMALSSAMTGVRPDVTTSTYVPQGFPVEAIPADMGMAGIAPDVLYLASGNVNYAVELAPADMTISGVAPSDNIARTVLGIVGSISMVAIEPAVSQGLNIDGVPAIDVMAGIAPNTTRNVTQTGVVGNMAMSGVTVDVKRAYSVTSAVGNATMSGVAPDALHTLAASAPTQPVISAAGGDTTVTISLTSGGVGATSYDLKWGTSAGSRPNTITGVTLPYTHTGRSNGTTYYYSLVATNAQGSTESAEVSAAAAAAETTIYGNTTDVDSSLFTSLSWPTSRNNLAATPGVVDAHFLNVRTEFYYDGDDEVDYTYLQRSMMDFTITQGASYSSAVLHLYVESVNNASFQPSVSVQESAHLLEGSTYNFSSFPGAPDGASFGQTGAISAAGAYTITLNASGLAYLNSIRATGGTAKFILREYAHDFMNVQPQIDTNYGAVISSADHATESHRPKLVVL